MASGRYDTVCGISLLTLALLLAASAGCTVVPAARAAKAHAWQADLNAGDSALNEERVADAEKHYRQALSYLKANPHSIAQIVQCQNKLANVLALEDKIQEAQAVYWDSLKLLEDSNNKESPQLVPVLFALGSIYESAGNPSQAMSLYQRALAISEKHYGPYSPAVANSLEKLGLNAYKRGDKEKAKEHYQRALSILEQEPGLQASNQLERLSSNYNDLLKETDTTPSELVSDFQTDVLNHKANKGSNNSLPAKPLSQSGPNPASDLKTACKLNRLAFAYYRLGQLERAAATYQRALAATRKAAGPQSTLVAACLKDYAQVLHKQGRIQEAKQMERNAQRILSKSPESK